MKVKTNKIFKYLLDKLLAIYNILKPSLLAIGIGISIGFIIMLIFNPVGAFSGLFTMLSGGLHNGSKAIGDLLLKSAPIILTGLSLVVAFKTGLFNIGAPGQMAIGGYIAIHVGVLWNLPSPIHWMVAIVLGMIGGAIWASIPGIFKALLNTNEVVSSIMLNYIATYLVVFLIKENVENQAFAKSKEIMASARLPRFGNLFSNSQANIGILFAILAGIIIYLLFKKTTLGYELKASGFNRDASKYAGMNPKKNIIYSMAIAGLLAGLAGAIQYLVAGVNLGTTYELLPEGFDGISVALLGQTEPIGAILSGIFLSYIRQGGFYMQIDGFNDQIIEIIIAVIIYVTSITMGIQIFVAKMREKKALKENSNKEVGLND